MRLPGERREKEGLSFPARAARVQQRPASEIQAAA